MTREEALKGLKVLRKDFSGYKPNEEMFDMAIESLQQESKHGKWILGKREWEDNYIFTCSECSHDIVTSKTRKIPYCWFCGARMENNKE